MLEFLGSIYEEISEKFPERIRGEISRCIFIGNPVRNLWIFFSSKFVEMHK